MTHAGAPGQTPAGWYPSPWDPRQLRWWDGQAWTGSTAPYPAAAAPGYQHGDPRQDLDDELKSARVAMLSLIVVCVAQLVSLFVLAVTLGRFIDDFRHQIDAINASPDNPPDFQVHYPPFFWVAQLSGLAGLVCTVLFMLWAYHAAQLASRLGLPARHSPGWAIGGFFVPIINLWFPYQCLVDTLPPGHPRRGVVGRWWTCYLLQLLVSFPVIIAAFAGTTPALIAAACCAPFPILTLVTARRMVDVVVAAHRELVGTRS